MTDPGFSLQATTVEVDLRCVVVGIDPGARYTGLVVRGVTRTGADPVLLQEVVSSTRAGTSAAWEGSDIADADYLHRIAQRLRRLVGLQLMGFDVVLAMEGVVAPNRYSRAEKGGMRQADGYALAYAAGYIAAELDRLAGDDSRFRYDVRPHGNGHGALAAYPFELMTDRERQILTKRPDAAAGQNTDMRHVRSAWDVTSQAITDLQLRSRPFRDSAGNTIVGR